MVQENKILTFINAFESSPVHCLKSRPSGKRRIPGYGGTADILQTISIDFMPNALHAPSINVLNDIKCAGSPMFKNQVILNPRHKVVFKDTFDELVEYIWCD